MNQEHIFLPVFTLVMWTFAVMTLLFLSRVRGVKTGQVRLRYFKALQGDIPEKLATLGRHFANLFELPVLFYAVTIALFALQRVDGLYLGLCWAFVISRLVHGLIHITYNHILHRLLAYFTGAILLMIVWIRLFLQIVGA